MTKNNVKKNMKIELKKIDRKKKIAIKKLFTTLGYGFLIGISIYVIGFLLGTIFYSKEDVLHIRIDKISVKITYMIYLITALISTPFVIRLFKLKNQKDILKSIQ